MTGERRISDAEGTSLTEAIWSLTVLGTSSGKNWRLKESDLIFSLPAVDLGVRLIYSNKNQRRIDMIAPPPAPPPTELLSTNFSSWSAAQTVAYARRFVTKVTAVPLFMKSWPDWVAPTLARSSTGDLRSSAM